MLKIYNEDGSFRLRIDTTDEVLGQIGGRQRVLPCTFADDDDLAAKANPLIASAYAAAVAGGTIEERPYTPPPTPTPEDIARNTLIESDTPAIRVVDDLVAVLISKGVIRESDMPGPAMEKLAERQAARDVLGQ